eukprot:gene35939-48345_t
MTLINEKLLVATVVDHHTFTVHRRYLFPQNKILGLGTYGVVASAFDSIRNTEVAIKRVRPYAEDEVYAKQSLREIRCLSLLRSHPNVISLYNLSINEAKQELYYVMESMEIDLDKIINKSEQVLTEPHIKCLMKQLLEGLKAIHSLGINHRDIKPANLLVNQDCQLRITDFGLARFVGKGLPDHDHLNESVTPMTEYVVTRWYRAPEILLAPGSAYSDAIDIWSAGCVCAEMFLRKPLFPGEGYIDQVQLIFKVIGLQDLDDLGFTVSDSVSNFLNYRCLSLGESYSSLFPGTSEESLQFLEAMLTVNPFSRPSASLALTFPFVSDAE